MDEKPARPSPPPSPMLDRFEVALQHMGSVERVMPQLHLALGRADAMSVRALWNHLMQCLAAARPAMREVIGDDGGTVVDAKGEIEGRHQVRLIRCDTCRGLVDLTIGGQTISVGGCRCLSRTEESIIREAMSD